MKKKETAMVSISWRLCSTCYGSVITKQGKFS